MRSIRPRPRWRPGSSTGTRPAGSRCGRWPGSCRPRGSPRRRAGPGGTRARWAACCATPPTRGGPASARPRPRRIRRAPTAPRGRRGALWRHRPEWLPGRGRSGSRSRCPRWSARRSSHWWSDGWQRTRSSPRATPKSPRSCRGCWCATCAGTPAPGPRRAPARRSTTTTAAQVPTAGNCPAAAASAPAARCVPRPPASWSGSTWSLCSLTQRWYAPSWTAGWNRCATPTRSGPTRSGCTSRSPPPTRPSTA
jgi:hypothetical protein